MKPKAWTYRQITEKTEESLRSYIQLASETNDSGAVHVFRCMANGALALWRDLTQGWQIDDSGNRLRALVDQVGIRPTVPEADPLARFNRRVHQGLANHGPGAHRL